MESNAPPVSRAKSSSKTLTIIAVLLVVLVIPGTLAVSFLQNFNQMTPHSQSFFRAMGTDFITGRWAFNETKATAQRNLAESKQKLAESTKRVEIAERKYQEDLKRSWKEYDAAVAAKRKAKSASAAKAPSGAAVANP